MTQAELAKILDIDTTALSRYESGRGAKQMPSRLKDGLMSVFSIDEIVYIDTGRSGVVQKIKGNNNYQAGGSQTITNQKTEEYDDAIINAIVKMLKDFDEVQKLTALQRITEISLEKKSKD